MLTRSRHLFFLITALAFMAGAIPACSSAGPGPVSLMPEDRLPGEVQAAPSVVKQAYQFAGANAQLLEALPCYCGCESIGHTSNYSCYVAGENPAGTLDFDSHALGCSICVDITQDAMRLLKQGRSLPQIRAYVDDTYGRYGTSNMPED